jgi:hypothetical protein
MNPGISRALTDEHIRELRQQAARSGTGDRDDRDHAPWLRRRIGFAMIEAGTRMLATTRPAAD